MIKSYVLIIGAMKSGTTTLFDALAQHPAIAPCTPKEPGFFAFEEVWAQGFDWYESLFHFDPQVHRFALDGSTDYTKRPFCDGVAARLAASAPRDFHLIYIMRHPLRRIESHARHTQRTKREVGRFPSPRADHSLEAGISPVNLAVSRYAYQLEPYRPFLDRGRLHLTSLEALHANFEAEIARILALIGLPPAPGQAQARHSNRANEKGQPTWLSNRLRHGRALSFLSSEQRTVIARRFERRLELPGRFRLTREEMTRLCNVYNAEMDRLSREFEFLPPESWRH